MVIFIRTVVAQCEVKIDWNRSWNKFLGCYWYVLLMYILLSHSAHTHKKQKQKNRERNSNGVMLQEKIIVKAINALRGERI